MNIYELSERSRVPLKTLRKLDKLGVLKIDAEDDRVSRLVFHMRGNMTFPLSMLLWMLEDPALVEQIAVERTAYAERARAQLSALGDVAADAAPKHVTAVLERVAKGDSDAVRSFGEWVRSVLPVEPVGHAWIAARLLYPLNDNLRDDASKLIPMAMLKLRRDPEFSGWWTVQPISTSTKAVPKNMTIYRRPANFPLDL